MFVQCWGNLCKVPRTNPGIPIFHASEVQQALERLLYIWAIKHPASGYVQGINDLATPFFDVFLYPYVKEQGLYASVGGCEPGSLGRDVLLHVEADSYWCLTKLLDDIHDHYTTSQPGLQRMIFKLDELVHRIDRNLHNHLHEQGISFVQFAFRWMNCFLMREINLLAVIRLWDTYIAEDSGFSAFHVYVCGAFLLTWSGELCKMEFQDIVMFLQNLPTQDWGVEEVEVLLSQAYILQTLFAGSPAHCSAVPHR